MNVRGRRKEVKDKLLKKKHLQVNEWTSETQLSR